MKSAISVRRALLLLIGAVLLCSVSLPTQHVGASGTGGQLGLGPPSLSIGQVVMPVSAGSATNAYSGFNAHLTFPALKLSYASVASAGALETSGGTVSCVGVSTDAGGGGTAACNVNGTQQTTSSGTLANMTLNRVATQGCAVVSLVTFGAPDNGTSSTGSYTINSADSTPQSNSYGTTSLSLDLATGAVGCVDTDNDAVPDPSDNCLNTANTSQTNSDADTFGNACDNCPTTTNQDQANTDGDPFGDACELPQCMNFATAWSNPAGDSECDGFPDTTTVLPRGREDFIGTDAADRCADTTAINDERGPAFGEPVSPWPPDFNDNRVANLSDVVALGPVFNTSPPNPLYNARFDLNASNGVNLSDVVAMGPFFNKSCTP